MISRYDSELIAHRARIAAHTSGCRSDDCAFCEAIAEDRKWEREGIA